MTWDFNLVFFSQTWEEKSCDSPHNAGQRAVSFPDVPRECENRFRLILPKTLQHIHPWLRKVKEAGWAPRGLGTRAPSLNTHHITLSFQLPEFHHSFHIIWSYLIGSFARCRDASVASRSLWIIQKKQEKIRRHWIWLREESVQQLPS